MKKQFQWNSELRIHILCWIAFIVYELIAIGVYRGAMANLWVILSNYLFQITFFYIHALMVLPYSFNNRSEVWWRLPVFIFLEVFVFVIIYGFVKLFLGMILGLQSEEETDYVQYFAGILFRSFYILFISTCYYFFMTTMRRTRQDAKAKLEIEELKRKLLQSELSNMRAQINPKLLFNTLEYISENTIKSPEKADEAIMILANRLDFASRSDRAKEITLGEELEQVDNLINLHRMRLRERLNLHFVKNVHDDSIRVLPLALINIVENLFDYGDLEDKETPAELYVSTSDEKITYKVRSFVKEGVSIVSLNKKLEKIRKRLEADFPNRFDFESRKEGRWYITELTIHIIF